MKVAVSKAEQESQAIFDKLVRLGILPKPPEDELFAPNASSALPPVGLPRTKRSPIKSKVRFVTLARRPSSKRRPSIFKNIPSV